MIKLTVSGSFRTSPGTDKNRHDFFNVTGLIPDCSEEYHIPFAQRMFPIWKQSKDNKKINEVPFSGLIKVYVDAAEEGVSGKPSCIGKNIKEMTWEELQDLACYLNLREIPLYRQGSLRAAQEKAYEMYKAKVEKCRVFKNAKDLTVYKETRRRDLEILINNQEEVENRIRAEIAKGFNMIVDKQNPALSYNFAALPPIVVKAKDGEKFDKETAEDYNSEKSESDAKGDKSPKAETK